ncbi:molybdopterin molybdotransferase MoeA [Helicobacter sp. 13S00477-4]|uniref:molybdopterin molybdotransferase MoeA n=1 Tax=Helicobacter sp. 13S00477-4 TaxID=1905759 RepID=UPI000BA58C25|nr:molybdopterin molybdotransferase MoeA [Helicobacter sp. 13S00477-4]PAF51537.1 hypothetical protein BKH44_05705 [Helicobacter sp. 13S00477-4]
MLKNISFYEAIQIIQDMPIDSLSREKIIFQSALGRVLADNVVAKVNMPVFCTSSMDGFAFNYNDLKVLQTEGLVLEGDNPAGEEKNFEISPKSTIKTFTGSKMPKNSDTILLVESAIVKDNKVFLDPKAKMPKKGDWVRQIGENYIKGEILLQKGIRIGPYEIGLLADANEVFVEVFRKPKVGILTGGAEILEVGEVSEGKNFVRSVNNHLLNAMVYSMGGEAILYPIMPDDRKTIVEMMSEAFLDCDILLTTGGMSMGDYDFTQQAMEEICEVVFKGVRMKPGKPVAYGIYDNKIQKRHLLALPGFPNSAAITFYLFGSILFSKMFQKTYKHQFLKATLRDDILRNDSRVEFRVCDVEIIEGRYEVSFSSKKILQSSVINNLCGDSALVILEENGKNISKGSEVEILLFKNFF